MNDPNDRYDSIRSKEYLKKVLDFLLDMIYSVGKLLLI